ncbi:MAG: COX15/CtaA family protein, partial [Lysobacterales bacterium]
MTTAPDRLRPLFRLALLAAVLCFGVVVFGAFVRLSHAGLSCPDWPTCYGKLTWPERAADIEVANAAFERPVEVAKAWREQAHRMLAGALVLATFALAWLAWRARGVNACVPWRAALSAATLIVFQALLGMWTVTLKLKPVIVMAHLLGGVATLALLVWIAARLHAAVAGATPATIRSFVGPAGSRLAPLPQGHSLQSPMRAAIIVAIGLVAIQIALGG